LGDKAIILPRKGKELHLAAASQKQAKKLEIVMKRAVSPVKH